METAINKELRIRNTAYTLISNLDMPREGRYTACSLWLMDLRDRGEISERQYHIYMADALRIEEEVNAFRWTSTRIALPLLGGYYLTVAGGVIHTALYNPVEQKWYHDIVDQELGGVTYWAKLPAQPEEERK